MEPEKSKVSQQVEKALRDEMDRSAVILKQFWEQDIVAPWHGFIKELQALKEHPGQKLSEYSKAALQGIIDVAGKWMEEIKKLWDKGFAGIFKDLSESAIKETGKLVEEVSKFLEDIKKSYNDFMKFIGNKKDEMVKGVVEDASLKIVVAGISVAAGVLYPVDASFSAVEQQLGIGEEERPSNRM